MVNYTWDLQQLIHDIYSFFDLSCICHVKLKYLEILK